MLARFKADGSPDTSFGANGVSRLNLGDVDNFRTVVVLDTGKIRVAGQISTPGTTQGLRSSPASARTASLDTSTRFGRGDGIYKLPAGDTVIAMTIARREDLYGRRPHTSPAQPRHRHARHRLRHRRAIRPGGANGAQSGGAALIVAISTGGKIAVTGSGRSQDATQRKFPQHVGGPTSDGSIIVLLNANGTLDNAFDANGVSFYDAAGFGRILFISSGTRFAAAASQPFTFESSVGMYGFAADGSYTQPVPRRDQRGDIARLSDGKTLIAGDSTATPFNADGTLDLTYSTDCTAQAVMLFPEHRDLFDQWGNLDPESPAATVLPRRQRKRQPLRRQRKRFGNRRCG